MAAGPGIGVAARYDPARCPAVRREIRANRVVLRVHDFLADALPQALARARPPPAG